MAGPEVQKLQEDMAKVIAELNAQKALQAQQGKDIDEHKEQKEKYEAITKAQAIEIESLKEVIRRKDEEKAQAESSFGSPPKHHSRPPDSADGEAEQDANTYTGINGFDYKNYLKPEKWNGKADKFHGWHELFVAQLTALDEKWDSILLNARSLGKNETIEDADMAKILNDLKIKKELMPKINRVLYVSLLQYTDGDAHGKTVSNGVGKALDTYKYLYQKGKNDTNVNIIEVQTRAMNPEPAKDMDDVEKNINQWKEDIRYLMETSQPAIHERYRKTILITGAKCSPYPVSMQYRMKFY